MEALEVAVGEVVMVLFLMDQVPHSFSTHMIIATVETIVGLVDKVDGITMEVVMNYPT